MYPATTTNAEAAFSFDRIAPSTLGFTAVASGDSPRTVVQLAVPSRKPLGGRPAAVQLWLPRLKEGPCNHRTATSPKRRLGNEPST